MSVPSLLLAAGIVTVLAGPDAPVKWTFGAVELANGRVQVDLSAEMEKGWHLYATHLSSDHGPIPTRITFEADEAYYLVDSLKEPEPEMADDPNFGMVLHFHSNTVVFNQVIARRSTTSFTVKGQVEYMACNDRMCLPPVRVPFTIDVPALSK